MKYLLILMSLCFLFVGCGPDLGVVDTGMAGYCNLDGPGNLIVRVKNSGDEAVGGSKTCVEFGSLGIQILDTPPLAAGATTILAPAAIPMGCYNPDCSFTITVDCENKIKEASESNNVVKGTCIG